ncbi:Hypothetical protein (plasmid) [Pseudomonas putida]|nr:Hypothetical protein [Pseudomonas putida]
MFLGDRHRAGCAWREISIPTTEIENEQISFPECNRTRPGVALATSC